MSISPLATDPVGDVIVNRYRVDAVLEAGTAWLVVAATDLELDRRVTLKLLHPRLDGPPRRRALPAWLGAAAAILFATLLLVSTAIVLAH